MAADRPRRTNAYVIPQAPSVKKTDNPSFCLSELCDLLPEVYKLQESGYECSVCDKRFVIRQLVESHSRSEHGAAYKCNACDKGFDTYLYYERHMLHAHSLDRPYHCETCGKRFSVMKYFMCHQTSHEPRDRKFVCRQCGKSYSRATTYERHMKEHSAPSHMCPVCGKFCFQDFLLKQHIRSHTLERIHACNQCDAKFAKYQSLLAHLNKHKGVSPYQCDLCTKSYPSRNSLYNHKLGRHTIAKREKKKCAECGALVFNLSLHMRIHNRTKSYMCNICQKQFQAKHHLQNHMASIHSDERPFQCDKCGLKFKMAAHMRAHLLNVHGFKKVFKCSKCDKTFSVYGNMISHEVKEHRVLMDAE